MSMVQLGELMATQTPGLNPAQFQDEEFELWSIPAFDAGAPERLLGREIGSAKKVIQPGDVLLSRIVPHIRRSWVVSKSAAGLRQIGSGEWIIFRSKRCDPNYLRHFLISDVFHPQYMQTVAGVGGSLLRARPEGVKEISLYLPPMEEQKRIAAILDQADALRRKRQRSLARLNQLGQAIFYEMFGDEEHTSIPLSDYFEEIRMGPFGSLLHKSDYIEGGIPLINPMHISGGEIVPDPNFSISQNKAAELENYRLRAGDLVIGRRGEMGRCAVVSEEHEGYLCGTGSMFLRAARDKTDPFFLSELIRSRKVVERIEAVASGVTMMNLNSKSFDRVMVPNVSISEQREYFRRVQHVAAVKPEMDRGLSRLVSLFASLQHNAFRGEL